MTVLNKYSDTKESLKELLIKNLPSHIKAGNEKHNSNIFTLNSSIALKTCRFINYNSSNRISFIIFDFDTYNNKNAKDTFKNIDMFFNYLISKVHLEPTFITMTEKGYQFAYHLKNHVFTNQKKAVNYLNNIKEGIIKKVGCDIHGSNRNYGVWRNPLKHNYYYSGEINYELKNFTEYAVYSKTIQEKFNRDITIRQVKNNTIIKGNRNNAIFYATMLYAKNRKNLTLEDIYIISKNYNFQAEEPLKNNEIFNIAKSVYKYYSKNLIYVSTHKKEINEGVMKFKKMKNLEHEDFIKELKKRQSLAAKRTNNIIGKDKKKEIMLKNKEIYISRIKEKNKLKIESAIKKLQKENKKITKSEIAKLANLNRKTVSKYLS